MSRFEDGWLGVDLDGTLAMRIPGRYDPRIIGASIVGMVRRVQEEIEAGTEVRIMTARVGPEAISNAAAMGIMQADIHRAIDAWCYRNIGHVLQVTCCKDRGMRELWDDRAVTVIADSGEFLFSQQNALILDQMKQIEELQAKLRATSS